MSASLPILYQAVDGKAQSHIVLTVRGPMLFSPADSVLSLARQETDPECRRALLSYACLIAPRCANVLFAVAEFAHSPGLRADCLHKGIKISSALWDEFGERHAVENWTDLGTRPLLRALFDLASLYRQVGGHEDSAVECLETLLRLDPNDHLGAQGILDGIRSDLPLVP